MVEMYRIKQRIGRSVPTGGVEKLRNGNVRRVHKFMEFYETDAGTLTPNEWKDKLQTAIEAEKELDVLAIIESHCKENCAWLHTKDEIQEYAMEILASRIFLCGNECWKDVTEKVKDMYIIFDFLEG